MHKRRTDSMLARPLLCSALAVLAMLLLPAIGTAQEPDEETGTRLEQTLAELSESFEILPLSDGYALRPHEEDGYQVLELRRTGIAIDGRTISSEELAELLGEAAEPVGDLVELVAAGEDGAEPDLLEEAEERELEARIREDIARQVEKEERRARRPRRGSVRTESRVTFGSSLTVQEDESSQEVAVLFGSLDVQGEVRGDAVVVGGSADIGGEVHGAVTVVGGSVRLGPEARVYGDVVTVGGSVHADPRARVVGEITEVAVGPLFGDDFSFSDVDWPVWRWRGGWSSFAGWDVFLLSFYTMLLALVVLLLVWLARDVVGSVAHRAALEPWKAGLTGLIVQVIFIPALVFICLILVISVVGIPLAVLFLPLSLFVLAIALFLGYAGVAVATGRKVEQRFGRQAGTMYLAAFLGVLAIQCWEIVGEGLSFVPGPIKISALILVIFGILIKYVAWTIGLGAVLLRQFAPLPPSLAAEGVPPLPLLDVAVADDAVADDDPERPPGADDEPDAADEPVDDEPVDDEPVDDEAGADDETDGSVDGSAKPSDRP